MTNTLKVFENKEFGKVRTVVINDEPWFVGKDVADALGYKNTKDALASHVDSEDKNILQRSGNTTFEIPNRGLVIINESGLYSLILSSKLPKAKEFKHWVTSEVLPSIRKNGGYIAGQETLSDAELMAKALLVAQRTIENKNKQITEMKPKAEFYDTVTGADNDWFTMNEAVKILNLGIGRNNTYKVLRWYGILNDKNIPYQRYVDAGYFRLIETTWKRNDEQYTGRALRVSSKGIDYIRKILQYEGYTYKKFEPCKGE